MKNKTLIILPGWGGSHETWKNFIDSVQPYFQNVVCLDLPCFGGNACPQTVWGVEQYAEYVKLKIAKMPPGDKVLLGHSFGGQVGTYYVAKNPGSMQQFILCAGAIFRPKKPIRRAFFWMIAKLGKLLFSLPVIENVGLWAKKVLYKSADSPDYTKTSGIQKEIFKKVIRQDLTTLLPTVTTPTLIVWGTHDVYVPVSDAKKAHQLIPGSKLKIIERGRHGLHLTQKQELLDALIEFTK